MRQAIKKSNRYLIKRIDSWFIIVRYDSDRSGRQSDAIEMPLMFPH